MSDTKIESFIQRLLVFLSVCLAGVMVMLSWNRYVSDSEFWAISVADQLGRQTYNLSVYYKLPFYLLLKMIYFFPLDNGQHVITARTLFAVIGLGTAWVFYRTARLLFHGYLPALLTLLLMSSTFFLTQSFQVRSDSLAALFSLLILFRLIRLSRSDGKNFWGEVILIMGLNTLMLASTPKAFFFLIALTITSSALLAQTSFSALQRWLISFFSLIGLPLVGLGLLRIVSYFLDIHVLSSAYAFAAQYFMDSSQTSLKSFLAASQWIHISKFAWQNPLLAITIALSLLYSLVQIAPKALASFHFKPVPSENAREKEKIAILTYSVILFAALILHNQKYPFFINSILPGLILGTGWFLNRVLSTRKDRKQALLVGMSIGSVCTLVIGMSLSHVFRSHELNNNREQKHALYFLEKLVSQSETFRGPGPLYYDGIGLLPRDNRIYLFPSPGDRDLPAFFQELTNLKPKLIFYTSKLFLFEPDLSFFLRREYVELGKGLWIRSDLDREIIETTKDEIGGASFENELRVLFGFNLGY